MDKFDQSDWEKASRFLKGRFWFNSFESSFEENGMFMGTVPFTITEKSVMEAEILLVSVQLHWSCQNPFASELNLISISQVTSELGP